jgi:hypothetical protein
MEQMLVLQYIIIGLEVILIVLILALAAIAWQRFFGPASKMVETLNSFLASVAPLLGTTEKPSLEEIAVSNRHDLEQAVHDGFQQILITGDLAPAVRQAMRLFSDTNLATIHSAVNVGPGAMELAVEKIKPAFEQIAVIRSEIGTDLIAGLAAHYTMSSHSPANSQLLLNRK